MFLFIMHDARVYAVGERHSSREDNILEQSHWICRVNCFGKLHRFRWRGTKEERNFFVLMSFFALGHEILNDDKEFKLLGEK